MSEARDYHEFRGRAVLARIDYIKHLTTLASGAIVLLSTFVERLFVQPEWKYLIGIAFGGFIASLVFAVFAQAAEVNNLQSPYGLSRRDQHRAWVVGVLQYAAFLMGLVTLAVFALKNFF